MTVLDDLYDLVWNNAQTHWPEMLTSGRAIPILVTAAVPGVGLTAFQVRGDTPVAMDATGMLIRGTGAEAVVMLSDTWHAADPTNPDTGKGWEQGEMGQYVEAHGHDGTVSDALLVLGAARDGQVRSRHQPYSITEAKEVAWAEPVDFTENDKMGGRLVEALTWAYQQEVMVDALPDTKGLPPELVTMLVMATIMAHFDEVQPVEILEEPEG